MPPIALMAWLRALMTETGWPALLAQVHEISAGVAATGGRLWLGTRYGTLPEFPQCGAAGDRRGIQRFDDQGRVIMGRFHPIRSL
jgi:hypothetical protein